MPWRRPTPWHGIADTSGEVALRLRGKGISVDPPNGWDVRIKSNPKGDDARVTTAVFHAATVSLPEQRGDFGGGVVETLGPHDLFVSIFEYGSESVGTALFTKSAIQDLPTTMQPEWFDNTRMRRSLPGQLGTQIFFTTAGRAFCLYIVLGSMANRKELVSAVNGLLATITIDPVSR
jgi:hypothetical protein